MQRTKHVTKSNIKKTRAIESKNVQMTRQKARMIKKNHLKRLMDLKRQNLTHRRDTKQLMRKSEILGKKMMLAVQNIEKFPSAGEYSPN